VIAFLLAEAALVRSFLLIVLGSSFFSITTGLGGSGFCAPGRTNCCQILSSALASS
jgi:hypothetical protein